MKHQLTLLLFMLLQFAAYSQKGGERTAMDKALQKIELENYAGAIADLNKIIQADSMNAEAIFKRGYCHAMERDHKAALIDFNRAIFMNANESNWFSERGIAKMNLRDMEGACKDWKIAAKMGSPGAEDLISEYCPE